MPRTKGVNKSKAVRDYLMDHPKAKTTEIVEALERQGIKITLPYASKVKRTGRKRGRPAKAVAVIRELGVPQIKAALALIKVCGSTGAAKEALSAAAELKTLV